MCNCFIFGCLSSTNLLAQEIKSNVISNGGKAVVSTDVILSYTIGEAIAAVKTNSQATLIQGFEQPEFDTLNVGINDNDLIIPIKIYPNPTIGPVYIMVEHPKQIEWMVTVYNIEAQQLLATSIFTGINEIWLNQYPAGAYALVITTKNGTKLNSLLIEKIN
ncbi:MAG: T9SS type A sorting domain-containing protein [Chitinophagales bacterium]